MRSRSDRVLAGVAAGVAQRIAVDPAFVRVAFGALAAAGGAGVVAYLLIWAITPEVEETNNRTSNLRPTLARAIALGLQVLGALVLARGAGLWFGDAVVVPVVLAAVGSAVIWARSDDSERSRLTQLASTAPMATVFAGRMSVGRVAGGAILVAGGMVAFLAGAVDVAAATGVLLAVGVTTAGLLLVLGPGVGRLARQLTEERRGRIRSEERAEMAAHLHDSVLHTLALIQRADTPAQMRTLARGQERELRGWLHGRADAPEQRLHAAIDTLAGRVERLHGVYVDVVVVGDAPLDDRGRALVDACGEAMVNAARHSGATSVAVYTEVEPDAITAYIRDEGKGFDPDHVPADRRGIAHSIRGRMARHGGLVAIDSAPRQGTEVTLHIPRR